MMVLLGNPMTWRTVEGSKQQDGSSLVEPKENPLDKLSGAPNLDLARMAGKWYLISVASQCPYLLANGFKVESTTISLTPPKTTDAPMLVSTFRKLHQQCWEIKQEYQLSSTTGRFLLSNKNEMKNIDVMITETDYSSYAIMYCHRHGKITMKLYGRGPKVPDTIADKFEDLASKQQLGLDYVFQFPDYSFCETADKNHVLVM